MKKIIAGHVVDSEEALLAIGMKLTDMVAFYNATVGESAQVKKFTDKTTAAKRLFAVLPDAPAAAPKMIPGSVKTILRELYADPEAAFTLDELLDKCGCTKKVLCDDLARLKNPAYCGKAGTLVIEKDKEFGKYVTATFYETEVYTAGLSTDVH